ncbi:T9SS type A sorting domain-containing protein [bacterium]|nr:T9SS type A sorting domain-containing protein [bacterium]
MRLMLTLIVLILLTLPLAADPWPDEVVSVEYGVGAGFGQGDSYPNNILGPPDSAATPAAPSSTAEEVLTLGAGGNIVLAFRDGGILDGEGADFTIFENPFFVGGGPAIFREVGLVAVSVDGEQWVEFPYNDESFQGLAGVTPTNGSANPLDPSASGGDSFDLADVGLTFARYLRITDAGDAVSDNGDSFDLDAVAVIHGEAQDTSTPEQMVSRPAYLTLSAWPNPFNAQVTVQATGFRGTLHITLFDLLGRQISSSQITDGQWSWAPQSISSGTYLLLVEDSDGNRASERLVLVR